MNCMECGNEMVVTTENYEYDSLPGTVLANVEIRRCDQCDEEEVVLPRLAQLNRVLAEVVIRREQALLPAEFRFLRKVIGWSGVDLARRFGTTKETVSRWENGHTPIRPTADQLLRMIVASEAPIADYRTHDFEAVADQAIRTPIQVRRSGNDWTPQTACA